MKLGGNTKDTPTAWWERAAEEADVATEDPQEGRERERDRDMADVSLSLSLKALLYFFASGEKKQKFYLLFLTE